MPIYDYYCKNCDYVFDEMISMSRREEPTKKKCPECGKKKVRQYVGALGHGGIGDPIRLGITRPSSQFNEVLQKINDNTPRSNLHQKLSQGRRKKGTLD